MVSAFFCLFFTIYADFLTVGAKGMDEWFCFCYDKDAGRWCYCIIISD